MDPHPTEVFSNIKLQLRSFRGPMWWNDKIILTNQKKQKVRLPEIPPSHFSWEFICLGCRSNFVKPKNGEDKWATKKTLITFHYTGWLIGILIKGLIIIPIYLGRDVIPYITQPTRVFFTAQMVPENSFRGDEFVDPFFGPETQHIEVTLPVAKEAKKHTGRLT